MNILYYVTGFTDEEASIVRAWATLGANIDVFHERRIKIKTFNRDISEYSFVLFHQHCDLDFISSLDIPKVLWNFDLVHYDGTDWYGTRIKERESWTREAMGVCTMAFFTDGEAAEKYSYARWLPQAARFISNYDIPKEFDVLFAATIEDNPRRFLYHELTVESTNRYRLESIVRHKDRAYGKEYAKIIAQSKIIVAPDMPIKPNYWSNRVYVVCGHGGFMLHPYAEMLAMQYEDGKEIVFYHSREDLHAKIHYYLAHDNERKQIAHNGMTKSASHHTYIHRCSKILNAMNE